ncbi:hypothetical protein [Pseudoalteromonas sp. GB56]
MALKFDLQLKLVQDLYRGGDDALGVVYAPSIAARVAPTLHYFLNALGEMDVTDVHMTIPALSMFSLTVPARD